MSQSRTRTSVTELRKVTSAVHQGQPCQPCILCKKGNQSKYFHPKSWKDNSLLQSLRVYEPSINIQPESCICRPCRNEINNISEDGFIPRWRKLMNKCTQTKCCVPNCTSNVHKVTKLVDKVTVSKFFNAQNENTEPESATDEGAGLCKEHYGAWYRHINPFHTKCKTCDKTITDVSKSRACPEPDLIQKHLQENTDFSGQIRTEDRVCYACYRSHLFIIKHLNRTVHSTDSDLGSLIDRIKQDIPEVSEIQTLDQALTYASTFSAIQVGEALLKQTAVLFPSIYEVFRNKVMEITVAWNND